MHFGIFIVVVIRFIFVLVVIFMLWDGLVHSVFLDLIFLVCFIDVIASHVWFVWGRSSLFRLMSGLGILFRDPYCCLFWVWATIASFRLTLCLFFEWVLRCCALRGINDGILIPLLLSSSFSWARSHQFFTSIFIVVR